MQDPANSRKVLEERLLSKQREIVARLSGLKSDLTRNPIADLAKSHPLAAVAAALGAGLLLGLLMKRRNDTAAIQVDRMADVLAEKVLSEMPSSALRQANPDELRRIVRAEAAASLAGLTSKPREPSLVGQLLGTVGRNLLLEGVHYVVGRLSDRAPQKN